MKRILPIIILLAAGCAALPPMDRFGDAGGSSAAPAGNLRLAFLDVGQGDSTIISSSNEAMLIDAGPPGAGHDVVLPFLRKEGIDELKYIVATHYHEDHIGGIPEVIKGEDRILGTEDDVIPTGGVIDRGEDHEENSPAYEKYSEATNGFRHTARPGDSYIVGGASVEVVAANGELVDGTKIPIEPFDENSASVVLLVESGGFSFLGEADLTGGGGDPPYQTADIETELGPLVGDIDVLKVAHHGSATSTNEAFIEETDPELAIISVGDGNDYGHPDEEVVQRLIDSGAEVYQTERGWLGEEYYDYVGVTDDSIVVSVSDGEWTIE
jgi:competence protein ComEC